MNMNMWPLYLEINGEMSGRWACRWRIPVGKGLDRVFAGDVNVWPSYIRLPAAGDIDVDIKIENIVWNPDVEEVILQAASTLQIDDDGEIASFWQEILKRSDFKMSRVRKCDPTEAGYHEAALLTALPGAQAG